jgi:hypothetical protein
MMNLEMLVDIAEDGPWCGLRPSGYPRLHPSFEAAWDRLGSRPELLRRDSDAFSIEVFGPEPDPWRLGAIEVGLYGAIRLHQLGQKLSGALAEDIRSAAVVLFEDTCSAVPISELIWVLLHRPPPPMPPWLTSLTFAAEMVAFAHAAQQHGLAAAANHQLVLQLKACRLQIQTETSRVAA